MDNVGVVAGAAAAGEASDLTGSPVWVRRGECVWMGEAWAGA